MSCLQLFFGNDTNDRLGGINIEWYIGLDVGTTNIKACAFCLKNGERVTLVCVPTPKAYNKPGDSAYRYDAQAIFEAAVQALAQVVVQTSGANIRAIAVSSMAECGVFVDVQGQPLHHAITWFDPRSMPQADTLARTLGRERIYRLTGQICSSKFGLTKLLWEKNNNPRTFQKAWRWLSINDYILFRLSGRTVCDYSIASRTMALDIRKLTWSKEILEAADVPSDLFPKPVPGGTSVGIILPTLAKRLGLKNDVQIITGGHDHACAAVGTGTIVPGTMLDSMGTSEVAILPIAQAITSHDMYLAQASVYPHCSNTLYRVLTSMQACGASINWFLQTIGSSLSKDAQSIKKSPHVYLQEVAEACEEYPQLQYYPFLRGTLSKPNAGGVFIGFQDWHGLPHFAKALFDGMCCEFTYQLRNVCNALDIHVDTAHAVGGPSQTPYFVRRKADISGLTIQVPVYQEAACFGAALLAGVGTGDLTFDQIVEIANREQSTTFSPHNLPQLPNLYSLYCFRRRFIENCF